MKHATYLIVGGSRGIGLAAAEHYATQGAQLFCVSRGRAPHGVWIEADLASDGGIDAVIRRCSDLSLDALLYLGGTWEEGAFTDAYDFATCSPADMDRVLAVNLTAPIKLVQGLLPALRQAAAPRCLFVGALSGLDNSATREVANTASKYGLRGAVQALQTELPDIAFTVVNPGNVATPEVIDDIAEERFAPQTPIPMADLLATLDYALSLSPAAVAREINLAQTRPG